MKDVEDIRENSDNNDWSDDNEPIKRDKKSNDKLIKGLPFLKKKKFADSNRRQFWAIGAQNFWQKSSLMKWKGINDISKYLCLPLNKFYEFHVTHYAKWEGKYAKILCRTEGCDFQIWYKPTETKDADKNKDSEFIYYREFISKHSVKAHINEKNTPADV